MANDPDCMFCRIITGEAPASIVAEDELILAFMDIYPLTPGHLLVVPKDHHAKIATIPAETMAELMLTARHLAAALRATPIKTEGINIYLADGAAAGQVVSHTHVHVIPRWRGDGFRISIAGKGAPTRTELDETAAVIRSAAE
jgi:histidine triad (HIT) family protein